MLVRTNLLALATALTLLGCDTSSEQASSLDDIAAQLDEQVAEDAQAAQDAEAAAARAEADRLQAEANRLASTDPSKVTTEDMKRGQKLKGGGYLSTTLRAGIVGEQKLNLYQITHALNLFWGLEGRYPKDHDEFMEKIIVANGLKLEPLEEPYEYWYNPEDHELYKRVKPEALEAAKAEAAAKEKAANESSAE